MSPRPRILSVIGARPGDHPGRARLRGAAPLAEEILVHTGQHYDDGDVRAPRSSRRACRSRDHNLGVGSRPTRRAARRSAQERLAEVIDARAARRVARPRRHERDARRRPRRGRGRRPAGARRGRAALATATTCPRRRNRIETDRLADLLLAPTRGARATTSIAEGVAGRVQVTGDPLCDTLERSRDRHRARPSGEYLLATVHRNYNTDAPERLAAVLDCLGALALARDLPRAPAHPRRASTTWSLRCPPTSSSSTRSPTRACSRSSAARRRSPPTPAASSARPTCGACPA